MNISCEFTRDFGGSGTGSTPNECDESWCVSISPFSTHIKHKGGGLGAIVDWCLTYDWSYLLNIKAEFTACGAMYALGQYEIFTLGLLYVMVGVMIIISDGTDRLNTMNYVKGNKNNGSNSANSK